MFRCLACNREKPYSTFVIEIFPGEQKVFEEPLCSRCRKSAFSEYGYTEDHKYDVHFYEDGLTPLRLHEE